MDTKEIRRLRLRHLIEQKFEGKAARLAAALDMKPPQVHRWLNGGQGMVEESAKKICDTLQLSPGWLDRLDDAPAAVDLTTHPDLQEVPRVRFKLSAGVSGYAIEPEAGNGKPVFFRRDWFDLHGYRPEKLFAVRVSGTSMEPALYDGDLVVVNTTDTAPQDGEAFAINYEGELVIKRLRRDAGEWWATSDAADQRRFAPKRCTEDVKIIGRVVYKQSERV